MGWWSLAGAGRRERDHGARVRAPIVVIVITMVFGPLATATHADATLADLLTVLAAGPTLGLCIILEGLLLKEAGELPVEAARRKAERT